MASERNHRLHVLRTAHPRLREEARDFADVLSELLVARVFYGAGSDARSLHIVGDMADDLLPSSAAAGATAAANKTVIWGCGNRDESSLSADGKANCIIRAVRGPLTHSALRLDDGVPIGDPTLLLPAIYRPPENKNFAGKRLLVPHFDESRSDEALLQATGCDVVLRPRLAASMPALESFIDQVHSAEFVLTGDLHVAMTRAAYGKSFGYADISATNHLFPWRDFSASLHIPCRFHRTAEEAVRAYRDEIDGKVRIPRLLPLLTVAPFPPRASVLAKVALLDIKRHGPPAAPMNEPTAIEETLSKVTWDRACEPDSSVKGDEGTAALARQIDRLTAEMSEKDELLHTALFACDKLKTRADTLQHEKSQLAHIMQQRAQAVAERDKLLKTIKELTTRLEAIETSTSWQITSPVRRALETLRAFRNSRQRQ